MGHTNSANNSGMRFATSYGFVGGPLRGKRLVRLLKQAGYYPVGSDQKPDIVIAHSTGTWRIPEARLTIYVGIPLLQHNPLRTYLQTTSRDMRSFFGGRHLKRGMIFILHSIFYSVRNPVRNIKLMRIGSCGRAQITKTDQVVFISNKDDPWQQSEQLNEYLLHEKWVFISLPGCHDDIWINPERYVEITDYYAKRLLA